MYIEKYRLMHAVFMRRMRLLMGMVLVGRGIDGKGGVKLNLNNANLDRVIKIDVASGTVRWAKNALSNFSQSVNLNPLVEAGLALEDVRRICRKYLPLGYSKAYVRGKYELWFLIKYLIGMTRELSDRGAAALSGLPRAKPRDSLGFSNGVLYLSPLAPCPKDLSCFLIKRFGVPKFGDE